MYHGRTPKFLSGGEGVVLKVDRLSLYSLLVMK